MPKTVFQANTHKRKLLCAIALILKKEKESERQRSIYLRHLFRDRVINGEYFLMQDLENDPFYHQKYFRMKRELFEELFHMVKEDISHRNTHSYPIPPKLRLAITLRYLATGSSQVQLAISYRISPSSVTSIVRETMTAIIQALEQKYLPSPTHETWENSEKHYRNKWNFPFCVGAIDGKHIRIRCPHKSASTNYNYKGYFSFVLLAVVGGDYTFLVADIGAPGSESDAAIFAKTQFMKSVENKTLQLPANGKLGENEIEVPYVFVGDEAFPLKPWLMRPFPGKELDLNRRVYNYRLSRARRIVENAFGIWAARWRILFTTIDADNDLIHMIVRTTIILHNFLRASNDGVIYEDREENGSVQHGNWRQDIDRCIGLRDIPRVGSNNYSLQAATVRDIFVDYFSSDEGRVPGQEEIVTRS